MRIHSFVLPLIELTFCLGSIWAKLELAFLASVKFFIIQRIQCVACIPSLFCSCMDQMNLTHLYICNVCPPDSDPPEDLRGKLFGGVVKPLRASTRMFIPVSYPQWVSIFASDRSNLALGSRRPYEGPLGGMGLSVSPPIQYGRMMALGGVAGNACVDTLYTYCVGGARWTFPAGARRIYGFGVSPEAVSARHVPIRLGGLW